MRVLFRNSVPCERLSSSGLKTDQADGQIAAEMDISYYHYDLPKELIARYPLERGHERLLVLDRQTGKFHHRAFRDLLSYFRKGDLLVMNDSRVIPARIMGRKPTGGKVEMLLIRKISSQEWQCLVKASKVPRNGTVIEVDETLYALVTGRNGDIFTVAFSDPDRIFKKGTIPLPPYLERESEEADAANYQTVYAREDGSVASPTAGLHFTEDFLRKIELSGTELAYVTLHVGPGTFLPVRTSNIEEHVMHDEEYEVTDKSAHAMDTALKQGRRIVAVGTTTVRVLEHLMRKHDRIIPDRGFTKLFIHPGYDFKSVGALLTNFHLPGSTLLMLVCAFGGYDLVMKAYQEAIRERYRFYSYGDAMLII
jgi:S-adenosylmethionine:tRNA ribosyltransferase-isomerase